MPSPGAELLRYFNSDHLPPDLREVSYPFEELATRLHHELGESAEVTAGLRKLLESKDCFVRAQLSRR